MITHEEYLKAKAIVEEYEDEVLISHLDILNCVKSLPLEFGNLKSPFMSFYAPIGRNGTIYAVEEVQVESYLVNYAKITFQARPKYGDWVLIGIQRT